MALNEKLAGQQWQRYCYVRDSGHLNFIEKANRCEDFFAGNHWDPSDRAACREGRRPSLTINKVLGTLSSILGEQIDLRSEIAFRAQYGAPSGNSDILNKVFKYISNCNQLDTVRSEVFADGAITSRGYYDVRMNFDKSVTGNIIIEQLNPKNVIPDPDASEYDPDSWNEVFYVKWLTANDIAYLYNTKDAEELRVKGASSWAYGYDSVDTMRDRFSGNSILGHAVSEVDAGVSRLIRVIERQYRKLDKMQYFIHVKTGERKEIPHTWKQDRINALLEAMGGQLVVDSHIGERIRWTVTADNYVLHDEWSPYKHFTIVPYFPYFRYGRTVGLVENLIDPQELLNKTTSSELHVVTTSANSGWKIKAGSLTNMTPDELEENGAKSGLVLELDDIGNAEKILPNQIPQGLSELSRKGENYIKAVSMRGDAQTGMARADVSADQIDAQNAHGDTGLRKPLENLNRTDWLLARNILDLVQDYYTDPRIMTITHNDLTGETTDVSINWPDPSTGELMNDLSMGEYDFTVVSQKARQTMDESQMAQAVMLKKELGVAIPDEFLIENSNLINKSAMVKAIKEAASSQEALMRKQMEIMGQQLTLAELKAKTSKEESSALLNRSKAAHTLAQTQTETRGDPTGQMEAEAEINLKERQHQQDMAHDSQKHEQEMQIEREKHAHEVKMKEKESEDKRLLARAQAIQAMRTPAAPAGGDAKPKKE